MRLGEEAVKSAAGRVERALFLLRVVVNQRASVFMDPISE
jgi:hypothetical protein